MSLASQAVTRTPAEVVRLAPVSQATNGICYAVMGEVTTAIADLERMVTVVPRTIAAALNRKAYYFVPLTLNLGDETMIADRYDVQLADSAVCHRDHALGDSQCVFISTRLMEDSFAIAFEFFINVGHNFVERVGVSQEFADLVWKQVDDKVRGETSLDAYELRKVATTNGPEAEKAKHEYLLAAFSDAIAVLRVVAVSRRGLPGPARARLSTAGPECAGRAPAQDQRTVPTQSWLRVRGLPPETAVTAPRCSLFALGFWSTTFPNKNLSRQPGRIALWMLSHIEQRRAKSEKRRASIP